jgi:D-alanyl-lipoteichoic acid acyltransferase DltB (MBOAT superfamily)
MHQRRFLTMNYTSPLFWILFFGLYLFYWRLKHRQQNHLLLVASYIFYGFWDYRFLFLILISTVVDYIGGLGVAGIKLESRKCRRLALTILAGSILLCTNIQYADLLKSLGEIDTTGLLASLPHQARDFIVPLGTLIAIGIYAVVLPRLYTLPEEKRKKLFLTISMVANLTILGFFKYFDFFIITFQQLMSTLGLMHLSWNTLGIILPVGISFYTFQAMSYTIDIYRGEVEPTESFRDFALFVCFFPHLVAGPIMRAHTLLPQVVNPRRLTGQNIYEGILLVLIGLFKKLVIADNMAPIANSVFFSISNGNAVTGTEVLVGIYAFAFQIYGDFSGYSAIARGVSKWLGYELVVNFRMPYLAVSPSDFWRRWHISLSTWLRDYLYIPLGGNRYGQFVTYRNLLITMGLGGLWHGASWNFVLWGIYHGMILCIFRLLNVSDTIPANGVFSRIHRFARVFLMFHLTCFGWLLFRADSFTTILLAIQMLLSNFAVTTFVINSLILLVFHCGLLFLLEWKLDGETRTARLFELPWGLQGAVYGYLFFMIIFFQSGKVYDFIYFQF